MLVVLALCALHSGCYKRGCYRECDVSDGWQAPGLVPQTCFSEDPIITDWWNVFQDPLLEEYIAIAAANNPTVKEAWANVLQARALRNMAAAPLFPYLFTDATGNRLQWSKNGLLPFIDTTPVGIPRRENFYTYGFDAFWEIDLFGKNLSAVEAAEARVESAVESRNDALITVFAEVARNYMEARGFQREITIKERKLELYAHIARMIRQRKQSGLDSAIDLDSTEAELERNRSELPLLQEDFYTRVFRLSVLLGQLPETLLGEIIAAVPLQLNPDCVPLGIRSELLRRRPDVRKAERDLAAYCADVKEAIAQCYPSFALYGSFGFDSTHLNDWLTNGSQRWIWGSGFLWPLFEGGRLRANVAANRAEVYAAVFSYEKIVLDALAETETAIVVYGKELERQNNLRNSEEHHKRQFELTEQRFRKGIINRQDLYKAERQYLDTVENLIIAETRTLVQLVALYKALGGGWEL